MVCRLYTCTYVNLMVCLVDSFSTELMHFNHSCICRCIYTYVASSHLNYMWITFVWILYAGKFLKHVKKLEKNYHVLFAASLRMHLPSFTSYVLCLQLFFMNKVMI